MLARDMADTIPQAALVAFVKVADSSAPPPAFPLAGWQPLLRIEQRAKL